MGVSTGDRCTIEGNGYETNNVLCCMFLFDFLALTAHLNITNI